MPFKPKSKPAVDKPVDAENLPDAVVSIASTPGDDLAKLRAEVESLQSQLASEKVARGAAEQAALESAQAQGTLLQTQIQEVPTGKMVKVKRAVSYKVVGYHDDGRDIIKPVWGEKLIPSFFYKLDLPPSGGTDMKINGIPLYHGTVIEVDQDTLSTVKDMVYRAWDHERNISGSNENFYRKEQRTHLSARGMS